MTQRPNRPTAGNGSSLDLEIKDAQLIFSTVWSDLEAKHGKTELRFPREIIWLGGAPGSGKGTNTPFIQRVRDITAAPIVTSSLLTDPEAVRLKDKGQMVGDRQVISILLSKLLDPIYQNGVIVDGFPRTKVQVECLKMFYFKLIQLREEFRRTELERYFHQPLFQLALLFVEERFSVERQLKRGQEVRKHNERVRETGIGQLLEERATDLCEDAARNRYRVFKMTTFEALQSLRQVFHYHFIDASGPLWEVEQNIAEEFAYQSSLELDRSTFDRIQRIPLASQIVVHARQELVKRLDEYESEHKELFKQVIDLIDAKFLPIILRHAITGTALINSEDPVFKEPMAMAMLIDVFSERGYRASIDIHREDVPVRINRETFEIELRTKRVYRIQVTFSGSKIRRGIT